MSNEKVNFEEFINEQMFLNLAGCTAIVCGLVQVLKFYIDLNPLLINLICSFLVTILRIIFKEDFSPKGILLGLMQIVPILLGATGCYEFLKNIPVIF